MSSDLESQLLQNDCKLQIDPLKEPGNVPKSLAIDNLSVNAINSKNNLEGIKPAFIQSETVAINKQSQLSIQLLKENSTPKLKKSKNRDLVCSLDLYLSMASANSTTHPSFPQSKIQFFDSPSLADSPSKKNSNEESIQESIVESLEIVPETQDDIVFSSSDSFKVQKEEGQPSKDNLETISNAPKFSGFTSGNGKEIEMTDKALQAMRSFDLTSEKSAILAKTGSGFSTGSGKSVNLSSKARECSKSFQMHVNEDVESVSREIVDDDRFTSEDPFKNTEDGFIDFGASTDAFVSPFGKENAPLIRKEVPIGNKLPFTSPFVVKNVGSEIDSSTTKLRSFQTPSRPAASSSAFTPLVPKLGGGNSTFVKISGALSQTENSQSTHYQPNHLHMALHKPRSSSVFQF